jgi:hypothetical protein
MGFRTKVASLFTAQSPCRDMPDVLSTAVLLCTVALLTNVVRLPDALHSAEPRLSGGHDFRGNVEKPKI